MNAPDISINARISAERKIDTPEPGLVTPERNGQGLDDVAALFPGMEVYHDLRISGRGDAQLLCSVSHILNGSGAKIVSFSLRTSDNGRSNIKCRLSGVTSKDANEIVEQLLQPGEITSAQVEHVVLRAA